MSQNQSQIEAEDYIPPTREEILKDLEMALEKAKTKIESGRIRDIEREKVRISWIKAFGYLINSYRMLVRDMDLEELAERISDLEGKYE